MLEPTFVQSVVEEQDQLLSRQILSCVGFHDRSLSSLISLLVDEAESGGLDGRLYADCLVHKQSQAHSLRTCRLSGNKTATQFVYRLDRNNAPYVPRRVLVVGLLLEAKILVNYAMCVDNLECIA
jgi:hypothetical protein